MAIKINGATVIADNQAFTTTSTISATGNITGGNLSVIGTVTAAGINTGSSPISTTGNVTGGNILTGGIVSATGNITGGNVSATNLAGSLTTAAQANITSVGTLSSVSVTGNVQGGNLRTAGLVSATGNITGNFILGNGSQLTGIDATSIQSGTSNVRVVSSGGNVAVGIGGTANVVVVATTGQFVTGVNSVSGNITGGNVSATNLTGSLTTAAQANITSVGTLSSVSVTGNVQGGNLRTAGLISATGNITGGNLLINGSAQITGNLLVSGTETIFNVANLTVNDKDIIVANNVTGGANVDGAGIQAGNPATATWFFHNATTSWQSNISITPTSNGLANLGGASNFFGNAFLSTASVTGNVQGGNLRTAGLVSATGNITTAGQFIGAGTGLTGTAASLTVGAATSATTAGTVTTAAQPNITSVGTLTSVTSSGLISTTGNVTGANITGTHFGAGTGLTGTAASLTVGTATVAGTVTTAAQPNITSVGTLSALAVTGNTTSGNFIGTLNGSGANVTAINANNISSGTLAQARLANAAVTLGSTALTLGATVTTVAGLSSVTSTTFVGALTGAATTAGTVTTAAQPNITSVGTMSTATITTLSTSAITKTGTNAVGNIGQTDNRFNTVFATATSALYADLAEKYVADAEYAPGTVVVFGGTAEVTVDATDSDRRVAGVVSTNPAYIMNDGLAAPFVAAVALTGRVPCLVTGTVRKGDLMVTAGLGRARAEADPRVGTVIGKALEDHDGESGTIEVVVGRF